MTHRLDLQWFFNFYLERLHLTETAIWLLLCLYYRITQTGVLQKLHNQKCNFTKALPKHLPCTKERAWDFPPSNVTKVLLSNWNQGMMQVLSQLSILHWHNKICCSIWVFKDNVIFFTTGRQYVCHDFLECILFLQFWAVKLACLLYHTALEECSVLQGSEQTDCHFIHNKIWLYTAETRFKVGPHFLHCIWANISHKRKERYG